MSLQRQLLVILLALISGVSLIRAGFLTVQRFLTKPSYHPLLAEIQQKPTLPSALKLPHQPATLPIIPTTVLNGVWSLSGDGVSLLEENSGQNDTGYIMYGHNWQSLLGSLNQTQIGETITLTYPTGKTETYIVHSKFSVPANRLDVLGLANAQTLLIYTCSGFLDTQRLVVLAQRQSQDLSYSTN